MSTTVKPAACKWQVNGAARSIGRVLITTGNGTDEPSIDCEDSNEQDIKTPLYKTHEIRIIKMIIRGWFILQDDKWQLK